MKNTCSKCAIELDDDARFCHMCGTASAVSLQNIPEASSAKTNSCPSCATKYTTDHTFCQIDGERLLTAEDMLPRCVVCFKRYDNDTTTCPIDGGEVKYIPKRLKRTNRSTHSDIDNSGMFKRMFSFEGRIRRSEYGITMLFYMIYHFTALAVFENSRNPSAIIIVLVLLIPILWILWAQAAKRCHDLGNSGWYQLIPFYGFLLLFQDGDKGSNEYGGSPKN